MRRFLVMITVATMFLGLLAGTASAQGPSHEQLERAGWDCSTVVMGEPHCVSPSASLFERLGDASIPVLVFGSDGTFRGSELLIRADLYAGQPCPQDEVLHLPFGYVACHHYEQ